MKNILKLGLLWIGALALSLTLGSAEGKCGDSQKSMMDNDKKQEETRNGMKNNGKFEDSKKSMMNNDGKCNADMKTKEEPKPAPMKGKCGPGKCG